MDEASAVGNTGDHQDYYYKFFSYKTSLDVDMASPPPYGSSRTTGGNTHGHALKNFSNIADTGDDNTLVSRTRNQFLLIQVMVMILQF